MQLDGLLDILRRTGAYRGLLDGLAQGSPLPDQHILRSARPFVLAALASDLDRPLLIIAGRVDRAHNIAEQLPVWLPGHAIERFAEPTSIFYERSPWTPSAIQNRLTTLASLAPPVGVKRPASEPPPIIVSSALALMQKTLPAREFRAASRLLRVGTNLKRLDTIYKRRWILTHGFALATVAHLLEGRYAEVVIASTHSYKRLLPIGSHPMTDPLLGSRRLRTNADWTGTARCTRAASTACKLVIVRTSSTSSAWW